MSTPTTQPTPTTTFPPSDKPPITTHILDTHHGLPAPHIPVTLTLLNPPSTLSPTHLQYRGTTNSDGRVVAWEPVTSQYSADSLEVVFKRAGDQKWRLEFETGSYWEGKGVRAFFGDVVVNFEVRGEEREGGRGRHWHVPVLLGPYGFTTYRGS